VRNVPKLYIFTDSSEYCIGIKTVNPIKQKAPFRSICLISSDSTQSTGQCSYPFLTHFITQAIATDISSVLTATQSASMFVMLV
jgi:hypothetical protein